MRVTKILLIRRIVDIYLWFLESYYFSFFLCTINIPTLTYLFPFVYYLESIQNAVNELFLQPAVHVGSSEATHNLLYRLHHHLSVLFILVLQVVHKSRKIMISCYNFGGYVIYTNRTVCCSGSVTCSGTSL